MTVCYWCGKEIEETDEPDQVIHADCLLEERNAWELTVPNEEGAL